MPVCDGWTAASYIRSLERACGWPPCRIVACSSEDLSPGSPALARCWDVGMDAAVVSCGACGARVAVLSVGCMSSSMRRCALASCRLSASASAMLRALICHRNPPPISRPSPPQDKAVSRDLAAQLLLQYSCPPSAFAAPACRSSRNSEECSLADLRRQPSAAPSDTTAASYATTAPDRSMSAPQPRMRRSAPPSPRSSMDDESSSLPDNLCAALSSAFYRSASS